MNRATLRRLEALEQKAPQDTGKWHTILVASDEEDCGEYHSSGDDEEDSEKRTQMKKFLRAATESRRNTSR